MRALLAAVLAALLLASGAARAQDPVAPPPPAAAPPAAYPAPAPAAPYPDTAPPPVAPPAPYSGAAQPGVAPNGYGYGYPMLDPARAELQAIDLRLSTLKQQQAQHGIGSPIAMTAAGFGILVIFGAVSLSQFALAEDIESGECSFYVARDGYYDSRCDVNDDGEIDGQDVDRARMLTRTFGALAGVAGGLGIVGAVWLGLRRAERSVYTPEIKALGARRKQILRDLKYGGYPQYGGMVLTLGARF
ncbi:MAG TPA: hypothetical protein VFZ61_33945 [Polyangiales bacterium]